MADDEQTPPLPTPAAPTATKQAVASALNAPDDSSVHVDSPLPPNSLFHRSIPLPADDIFDDDDDDLLAHVPFQKQQIKQHHHTKQSVAMMRGRCIGFRWPVPSWFECRMVGWALAAMYLEAAEDRPWCLRVG